MIAGAADAAAVGGGATALSTSLATILPPGPVPRTFESCTPSLAAIFRASGDAFTRSLGLRAAAGFGGAAADGEAAAAGDDDPAAAGFAGSGSAPPSSAGGSSPLSSNNARRPPTATFAPSSTNN